MFSLLLLDDFDGLPLGVLCTLFLDVTGVVDRTKDGVKGSGGNGALPIVFAFKLVLEIFNEHVDRGIGTLKLDERDCRPLLVIKLIPGDFGSGVRDMDTPEINNVGDFGIPVSDSYSFELSVSNG